MSMVPDSTPKDVTHGSLDYSCSQTTLSRDPRRASLTESQPILPQKSQNSQSVVQLLREFGAHVASIASISSERDHVAKKLQAENAELKKADERSFQYPSLLARGKREKQTQSDELASIEGKLQNEMKTCEEVTSELANRMTSNDARQMQLEQVILDVGRATAEATGAVLDAQEAKDDESRFDSLKSIVKLLGKSVSNHTGNLTSLKQNMEELRSQSSVLTAKEQEWVKLEQQLNRLEDSTRAKHEEISKHLEEFRTTVSLHKSLIDSSSYPAHVETVPPTSRESDSSQTVSVITSNIQSLGEQLQSLRELQETKDGLISDELENVHKLISGHEKALEKTQNDLATLRNRIEQGFGPHSSAFRNAPVPMVPTSATPSPSLPPPLHQMVGTPPNGQDISTLRGYQQAFGSLNNAFFSLKQDVDNHTKALNIHQVSLHSLEMRYNNLSSEPIVRQMVAAMQEMYPYASTVQSELEGLKKDVIYLANKQSLLLAGTGGSAVQNGVSSQNPESLTQKVQMQSGSAGSQSTQVDELASTVKEVTQKLGSLSDQVNDNAQIQELQNLREQVKLLAQSIDTAMAQVKETARAQLEAKVEKEALILDMNAERDRLNDEIKSVVFRIDDVEKVTLEKLAFAVHRSEKTASQIESLNQRVDEIVVDTEKGQQNTLRSKRSKALLSSDMTKSLPRLLSERSHKSPQGNQKRKLETFLRDDDKATDH